MIDRQPRLSDRQRISWLRLARTTNVGPASFRSLINRFGSADAALAAVPSMAVTGGAKRPAVVPSVAQAEDEIAMIAKAGARLIAIGEPEYPPLLKHIAHPPPILTIKGSTDVFVLPSLSIVGARNASLAGVKFAQAVAADVGRVGFTVISGLARGIDTAAHHGSLSTGTVAVLAGGLNHPYPPTNIDLFAQIAESGAVLSEMPFNWEPRAVDFPRRNRLIAGLGLGVLVIEAAERSGSLITARLANEQGRQVFAVPGSPFDPRSAGSNRLLKEGASLVTEANDIISALAPTIERTVTRSLFEEQELMQLDEPREEERDRVVAALSPTPSQIDELIRFTNVAPATMATILLELDLAGRLQRHSGGHVSLL